MMTCTAKELCAATGGTLVQDGEGFSCQHRQPPGGAGLPVHPTGG
ncbi:MAG: hypothetical protein ACLR39_02725 [Oscillospiraceae bacterium]